MLLIMQILWSHGKTEQAETCQLVLICYAWSLPGHSSSIVLLLKNMGEVEKSSS